MRSIFYCVPANGEKVFLSHLLCMNVSLLCESVQNSEYLYNMYVESNGCVSTIWQLYHYIIVVAVAAAAAAAIIHIIFIWIELSFLTLHSALTHYQAHCLIQSRTIKPFTVSLNKRKHGVLYFKQLIHRTNFCAIRIEKEREGAMVCVTTVICDAIQCDMSGNVHYSNR